MTQFSGPSRIGLLGKKVTQSNCLWWGKSHPTGNNIHPCSMFQIGLKVWSKQSPSFLLFVKNVDSTKVYGIVGHIKDYSSVFTTYHEEFVELSEYD